MPNNKKSGNFTIFLLKGFIILLEPIVSLVKLKIQLLAEKIIKIIKIHKPRPPGGSSTCASPTPSVDSLTTAVVILKQTSILDVVRGSFMQKFLTVRYNIINRNCKRSKRKDRQSAKSSKMTKYKKGRIRVWQTSSGVLWFGSNGGITSPHQRRKSIKGLDWGGGDLRQMQYTLVWLAR